ncbi:U3 snoRNA associated-domain-containing protein [Pyrenochaeta sp. MPI-SDFR-AT-0127]|nr:U3 snoRNA associated-domain-containing protein [Pyrenochaeta sp. MPI-SDFR-AT-0127]
MFARVFDTAKRILSRSPSVQERSSELRDTPPIAPDVHTTMVTTRGGTDTPGATATPRSSTKKRIGKRELESLDTPTQVKRQRKTATPRKNVVQETAVSELTADDSTQESGNEILDTIVVTVPSSDAPSKEGDLPIRRRSSPKVVAGKLSQPASAATRSVEEAQEIVSASPQDTLYQTPEHQSGSVYATPATHMNAVEGSPTPRAKVTKNRTPASTKKSSGRQKKVQRDDGRKTLEVTEVTTKFLDEIPSSTQDSEEVSIASQDAAAPSSQLKKAHMRFGSEEPTEIHDTVIVNQQGHERYTAPEVQAEAGREEDDDASDSDEAPEVVTTAAATSKANLAQQEAKRALQAQQAADQAKRQKREERIAEEQAQKRIREEAKAKKHARKLAKEQRDAAQSNDDDTTALQSQMSVDMGSLPALLPDSLLEAIDDQRPPTPPPQRRGKTEEELRKEKLNHHIKFLERTDKPAKDVKKGKLSVAVLGQQNRVLPPKVNRDTRNVRELWLKGRKAEKKKGGKPSFKSGKMERRAHGLSGFLRGED